MRRWNNEKLSSIGPICPPALSTAALRASFALLEGKPIQRNWTNRPKPIVDDNLAQFYRSDLTDAYWAPTEMPNEKLLEYFKA
jgi:ribose transport system substrate-binding protein